MSSNWNHRYRATWKRSKVVTFLAVAEVVRNRLEIGQRSSTGERKMLDTAAKYSLVNWLL